ncbi:tRNA glutamyl-Q(34) synthetase GluQRS [Maritalea mediterranea]|uniref:tRNA glutamyl-Q(34) synthetase GluQRS n=1 Tax=Maritalea mediterranea TaxID=2909667 RepID=A0ABS9E985_9HYPH|nr:tRNA glutamyl-Q(34) synthetase GluQRS [Maritalea mediterranea]MCF4099426.1 tRNA glutamyl-Q(34) synthetase GluQRS [Maritalea mediterranea]
MTAKTQPVFRFAPSPNGHLHLGHAYSALLTNRIAQHFGGQTLLRIEDIDVLRCTPELVDQMLEDLAWIGFEYQGTPLKQSDQFDRYRAAADTLKQRGLIYPCFCSRKQIRENADGRKDPDGAPIYPGICRHLSADEIATKMAQNLPHSWRLNMQKALAETGTPQWREVQDDLKTINIISADPMAWGDVVLVRKDTPTSYHLSVVLDDALQHVTHVTRGKDLYFATAIHRVLQTLLNLPEPLYHHHELIRDDAAEKLSKSKKSQSLKELRDLGWSAQQVRAAIEMD